VAAGAAVAAAVADNIRPPARTAVQGLRLGIGWRPQTAGVVLSRSDLACCEVIADYVDVHQELPVTLQEAMRRGVEVIPHGIGLSLGGADRPSRRRLHKLAAVAGKLAAPFVSEHIAFVRARGREAGHLLPVPRTAEAIEVLTENINIAQAQLPVPLVLEHVASLFEWPDSDMDEPAFLNELVERTGVRLLLDLANLYVNAANFGFNAVEWLRRIPLDRVAYVHVAGGRVIDGLHYDTHADPIWREVLELIGVLSTLRTEACIVLERDSCFPTDTALSGELDAIRTVFEAGPSRHVAKAPS
jgi:uncharacterized protein (UPF0276 family)